MLVESSCQRELLGALWIHTRWGRRGGSAGFWTVTQSPPPSTNSHTFCVSGMLQPKLKQAPQGLSLYSLRFEPGTWPCSRWAGSIPRAPFLLLCFGSGILQALRLSPCLPLCIHLLAPWEGTSPYVCALLSLHLLCWSVHDFPLFAEALSALHSKPACWAAATTRGAWPPHPLHSHVVQNMASPTLEQGGDGTATICCGSCEAEGAALPTAGRAACSAPGAGWRCPTRWPQAQLTMPQLAALRNPPSGAMEGTLHLRWAEQRGRVGQESRSWAAGQPDELRARCLWAMRTCRGSWRESLPLPKSCLCPGCCMGKVTQLIVMLQKYPKTKLKFRLILVMAH